VRQSLIAAALGSKVCKVLGSLFLLQEMPGGGLHGQHTKPTASGPWRERPARGCDSAKNICGMESIDIKFANGINIGTMRFNIIS
jgi:hypothetical protein